MKSVKFLLAAVALLVGFSASAQDFSDDKLYGKWGATAEERASNIGASNFLKEAMDAKDYAAATVNFQQLLQNCPAASVNTFTRGTTLYKNRINRARNLDEKRRLVDSLILIHDLRIQYFGDDAKYGRDYILDLKARDVLKYCSQDRVYVRQCLKEAIDAAIVSNNVKLDIVVPYFKNLCDDYKFDDTISSEMILTEYERLAPLFDASSDEKAADHKKTFEDSFASSGAANCDNLESLFSQKLASNPNDTELLSQAVALMSRANCSSSFFLDITERYYTINPSSETALFLAKAFQDRKETDKALKYLREALAVEADPSKKESLLAQIAIIELSVNNYSKAADAARALQGINPQNGYSYFVLGQCYASSSCASDKIGGASVYWAAYDAMTQAVDLLSHEPEVQKVARSLAGAYRSAFPTQETCFFAELSAGQGYTVSCGFASGKRTTVRYR
ncbi:MAG: enzyme of heme biosynthesis [Alistipes sp.]|nr:enzyme of heme biosynthesis [Alistipes sp.]